MFLRSKFIVLGVGSIARTFDFESTIPASKVVYKPILAPTFIASRFFGVDLFIRSTISVSYSFNIRTLLKM
jgi:hypothetical protein